MKTEEQKRFGPDAEYFIALQLLKDGNEKAAISKLNYCAKKGTFYCALESKKLLCTLGTYQQKNQACENLLNENPDVDSLLIILNNYVNINDFQKVIEIAEKIQIEPKNNKITKIYLEALKNLQSPNLLDECYKWFTSIPISTEHYQFYRDSLYSFENAKLLFEYFEQKALEPTAQLSSDIGKAYLYGNGEVVQNAIFFSTMAEQYKSTPMEFYFWFYAGRLFDKASLYTSKSRQSFENAIKCASSDLLKDNAIWYLLNTSLSSSINSISALLKEYAPQWSDPSYFDDFFDALSAAIFTAGDWNLFNEVYESTKDYTSDSIRSQFAYLLGRLIQIGHINSTKENMISAFEIAYSCENSIYYSNLAKYQLIQNNVDTLKIQTKNQKQNVQEPINVEAGILM